MIVKQISRHKERLAKSIKTFFLLVSLNLKIGKNSGVISGTGRKVTFLQVQAGRSLEENYAHAALWLGDTSRRREEAKGHLLVHDISSASVIRNCLLCKELQHKSCCSHPSSWERGFPEHVGELPQGKTPLVSANRLMFPPSLSWILERADPREVDP